MCEFENCNNKSWKNGYCYTKHRKLANAAESKIVAEKNVNDDIVITNMAPRVEIVATTVPVVPCVADKLPGDIKSSGLFEQIFDMETGGPSVENLRAVDEPFYESFDHSKLAFILNNIDTIKKLYRPTARNDLALDKYYLKSKSDNRGLGSIRVKYIQNYRDTIRGRYQAVGSLSGQAMVREVRHTIFDEDYIDMDMDNCHPVITVWMCGKLGIQCEFMAEYVANREERIREIIAINPSLCREDVKKLFLSINYGGKSIYKHVENKTEFLVGYYKESAALKVAICGAFPYFKAESDKSRVKRKADYNLPGAAMSHVCCFVENQLLMIIVEYLREKVGDVSDSILCFDGIMIKREKFDISYLSDLESIFSDLDIPMKLSVKDMKPIDLEALGYDCFEEYSFREVSGLCLDGVNEHEVDAAQYCLSNQLYDQRIYNLCCLLKRAWFADNTNLWNLAGSLYRKQHVDIGLMRKTYVCILYSMTDRFDQATAIKMFDDWETSKYHPQVSEAQLKQTAHAHNSEGYKGWKMEYEPTLSKRKAKIDPDAVEFTDNCHLRIEKVGRLNSVEKEFLLEGVHSVDTMLEEDWLAEYVRVANKPILGYKRTWQEYIRYMQAIKFSSKKKAGALLAMTIDNYIILMGNSFLYRCGLDSDYSNDVLTQAQKNPLDEMTMTYWCEDKSEYTSTKALKVYEQCKSLFHTYEEYANQWGEVNETKFSTCVPFKGRILHSVDDDVIGPFLNFLREIIANNDDELYTWLINWIAHIYKYPNSRTRCALILLSLEEGTGKGTFCDILTYLFGIHNIDQSGGSVKSLVSERSSHLVGKKFAMVQEMRENKGDYMGCMEALKTFITDDYIAVRPLYANKMTVRNLVELIMTTNNENILKTSVEGRRFTVAKVSAARKQDNAYFRGLKEHCQTRAFIDNFATYLVNVDVREGSIKALATEALAGMAEASQDSIAAYWSDILSQPHADFVSDDKFDASTNLIMISRKDAYDSYKDWCSRNNEIVFKNRKFQSDSANMSKLESHRDSSNRYWRFDLSE